MRMGAPGSAQVAGLIETWHVDKDGNRHLVEESLDITGDAAELVRWLEITWQMLDATLKTWTVADLAQTYRHTYWGQTYAVSRQWTVWRIMSHDIHHGGQLAMMLGIQGIEIPELGDLGGHITQPPLADLSSPG